MALADVAEQLNGGSSGIAVNREGRRLLPMLQTVADVEARDLDPLWPGVIWRGKTTLLVGDPGLGKSQVTLDVAARITRARPWPLTKSAPPLGEVLLLSAEDDLADTIRPRLEAAGADLRRVHFMSTVAVVGDTAASTLYVWPSLLEHVAVLREALAAFPQVSLLVIDPLTAFLSGVDSHKTSEVRAVLALLGQLASECRIGVLAVSHLNKASGSNAMHRVTGSLAFVAAARAAYAVARDPADPSRRVMLCVKNNLAKDSIGFRYSIKEADNGAPFVEWADEACELSADEVLSETAATPREAARSTRDREVEDWLREQLAAGPVPARTVWNAAKDAGMSEREIKRACRSIGVEKDVAGYQGAWHWALPAKDASPGPVHRPSLSKTDRL